jgi:hypothetical protein
MRHLSMVALRCTARHVLRGLAIVGPPCIHQHNAREAGGGAPCPPRREPRHPVEQPHQRRLVGARAGASRGTDAEW